MPIFNQDAECYCLAVRHFCHERVVAGALGEIDWPAGWLYYVGRAKKGWPIRLKRFAGNKKSSFWHIDYLVKSPHSRIEGLLPVAAPASFECELVSLLGVEQFKPVKKGFGASDCEKSCPAHAFLSLSEPARVFGLLAGKLNCSGWIKFETKCCSWQPL
ncbi:MAG: DUF123 domain-containing protein [bacterium]